MKTTGKRTPGGSCRCSSATWPMNENFTGSGSRSTHSLFSERDLHVEAAEVRLPVPDPPPFRRRQPRLNHRHLPIFLVLPDPVSPGPFLQPDIPGLLPH